LELGLIDEIDTYDDVIYKLYNEGKELYNISIQPVQKRLPWDSASGSSTEGSTISSTASSILVYMVDKVVEVVSAALMNVITNGSTTSSTRDIYNNVHIDLPTRGVLAMHDRNEEGLVVDPMYSTNISSAARSNVHEEE
jgi:hypothetical protein